MQFDATNLYEEIDVDKAIERRRFQLLRLFFWTAVILIVPILLIRYPILVVNQPQLLYLGIGLLSIIGLFLIFRKIPYVIQASVLCFTMLVMSLINLRLNGIVSIGLFSIIVVILLTFAFLGVRPGFVFGAIAVGGIVVVGLMTATGRIVPIPILEQFVGDNWVGLIVRYMLLSTIVYVIGVNLIFAITESLNNQHRLTEQLSADRSLLLSRVEESTKALTLTADISRQLTTILDTEPLLDSIVGQIQAMFGYYHVQVFLIDKETDMLVLRGGTGIAIGSNVIPNRRQTIPYNIGLVGLAATRAESILVQDISTSNIWIPHPDLPKTQAEVAIPVILGDEVIGVLNVHHHIQNGLTESDVSTLEAVTLQLATALTNARLFEEAFRQANHQAQINHITQRLESATDVYALVQMAAREIGQALGVQTKVQLDLQALKNREPITELET